MKLRRSLDARPDRLRTAMHLVAASVWYGERRVTQCWVMSAVFRPNHRRDAAICFGTVASERTASSRSGKVEALSSNRAARIAQSDQSRVSTAAFRARVEDVEGGDRQMQQCRTAWSEVG